MKTQGIVDILIVEDNEGDIWLLREHLKSTRIKSRLHVTRDGEEAMRFLLRQGEHAGAVTPDLILLDLNLPLLHGKKILEELKRDTELRRIPVVVLTSSSNEDDIREAYSLYCNAYITKPANIDDFGRVVDSIEEFWFNTARLP